MTVTLRNMPSSVTDVSVTLLDQTKLFLEPSLSSRSADGNTITAVYMYAGTNASYNTRVTVQSQYIPKDDVCRHSVRLSTTEADDASGEIVVRPVDAVIAWNTPGRFMSDSVKYLAMLGALYSLTFKTLVAKVPQPEWIKAVDLPNVSKLY